jgi:F-type H+-transporting ATPase subunit b
MYIITLFLNFLFLGEGEPHKNFDLLSVNPGLIIWTIVIFVLVLLVLWKIAWKPLLSALNNREETIRQNLENSENARKEAQELFELNKKNLADANNQSMNIISQAKETANKVKDEIIAKAGEESRKLIEQSHLLLEQEKLLAYEKMKEQISDIVIKAAEKVINESLDKKKHKQIIEEFLKKVPKN